MLDPGDKFFVANSDEIREVDLYAMRRFHEDRGADATVCLAKSGDSRLFGAVRLEGHRVAEFTEKPKSGIPVPGLVNAGLYLFQPRVLDFIPNAGNPMLEKAVFPQLARCGRLFGFLPGGRWLAINSLEDFERAEKALRS